MEEQRQRQDEEAKQAADAGKTKQEVTVADSAGADEDALLRNALSMSVAGVSAALSLHLSHGLSANLPY